MRGAADISRTRGGSARAASLAIAIAIAIAAGSGAGCTTTSVDVAFDDAHDFSHYRTWAWNTRAARLDDDPDDEPALDRRMSRALESALEERGLVRLSRARGAADLLVSYAIRVRREEVTVLETGAEKLLSSHHWSPSYLVQATTTRVDRYDRAALRIVVADRRRKQIVWRGELATRAKGEFSSKLPVAVSQLLEQLPLLAQTNSPQPSGPGMVPPQLSPIRESAHASRDAEAPTPDPGT